MKQQGFSRFLYKIFSIGIPVGADHKKSLFAFFMANRLSIYRFPDLFKDVIQSSGLFY